MVKPPGFGFEYDNSIEQFALSQESYLAARPDAPFKHLATGSIVLDTNEPFGPRVLLIQRAASDSSPNKWEPPGGACDDDDETILHGAARELFEETGLEAARIGGPLGEPQLFTIRSGKNVCRYHFAVFVKPNGGSPPTVKLDPKEHQNFVWATEQEVKANKVGTISLEFTRPVVRQIVLQAFDFNGSTAAPAASAASVAFWALAVLVVLVALWIML